MDISNFINASDLFSFGFLALASFSLCVSGLLLYIGAGIANIEERKFGKSIILAVATSIMTAILTVLFSIPILSTALGFLLGFCLSAYLVKISFNTTFPKAVAAIIFAWIISWIATGMFFFVISLLLSR